MADGPEIERQRRIYQALRALPPPERKIFSQFYNGTPIKLIARELGIPKKSAIAALWKARISLTRWLGDLDILF